MPCLCPIPFSISRMLAYRLWFYLGGNFRAFKPLVDGDSLALDKLKQRAASLATSDTDGTGDVLKQQHFHETLKVLLQQIEGKKNLEDLVQLRFGDSVETSLIHDGKYPVPRTQTNSNILVIKKLSNGMLYLCFHSRRVQYSFSIWLSQIISNNWDSFADGQRARINFLSLLERIELGHILRYQTYAVDESQRERKENELDVIKRGLKAAQEEGINVPPSLKKLTVDPKTLYSLKQMNEAKVNLVLLYYKAYQQAINEKGLKGDMKERPTLADFKMEPAKFYEKYKDKIDSKMSQRDRAEEDKLRSIMRDNCTDEVLKAKNKFLKQELELCNQDFKKTIKNLNTEVGISKTEIENEVLHLKKYIHVKSQLEKALNEKQELKKGQEKLTAELLVMLLDLMEDFTNQLENCKALKVGMNSA